MNIFQVVISLVIAGVIMWLINAYIPMQKNIKQILNIVIVIACILYVLSVFGILGSIPNLKLVR